MFDRQEKLFAAGADQGDLFGQGDEEAKSGEKTRHPLDVPQEFPPITSFEVREAFQELVRRDLLGPYDGDFEELPRKAIGPRERYLVGMLGPKPSPKRVAEDADELPETEIGAEGDGAEGELPDVLTPQNLGRLWASSMGMSFAVPGDLDALTVTARWGAYTKVETEVEDAKGRQRTERVWGRRPVEHRLTIPLAEPGQKIPLTMERADEPGVLLAVAVRPRPEGRRVVELTLINQQVEPETSPDIAWLFQAELVAAAQAAAQTGGPAGVFLPIDDPLDGGRADPGQGSAAQGGASQENAAQEDLEERHLRLLYRNERRYAVGRNVAVHAEVAPDARRATELRTTWLPYYDVPATVAPVGEGTALADVELSMDALAKASPQALAAGLTPLADGYSAWLDEQERQIPVVPEPLREAAEVAVRKARRAAERIRAGIALLTVTTADRHEQAYAAFRFANRAMALQRRRTAVAKLRDEQGLSYEQAIAEVDAQGTKAASWRPFQLAFMLLNLPSLTDPAHPERAADHTATVDLLFFPTGGGKTEAYLGLTAYTFAIRRLQKVVGSGTEARSGLDGVAVLMRYTLRLLTAQQFQRAAALVCACEVLRRDDPGTWGDEPFRIGLWVGNAVSPNWFAEAKDQIQEARDSNRDTNVLQTLSCSWCGEKLVAGANLDIDEDRRRVLLYCGRGSEGDADPCPFSRLGELRTLPAGTSADEAYARREGLPILTVDEEIYRLTPSLVIATVDKLAQLPWRGFAGHLFGRVSRRCPRHGYRHDDLDDRIGCGGRHNAKGRLPKTESRPVIRLRPPDLIIQDELHLISGALGTVVGLFEAAVDELCTWTTGGVQAGPKIIASTATTKRADRQVLGVFGRDLAVFPPQVIDVADTFFSRQAPVTPKDPGRRYLGVCAHGVRLKSAEIRLAEILLLAGQTLFDGYGEPADPYMTLVGYFNATRELAGMRRYMDDDVTTRIRMHGRQKKLSNRLLSRTDLLHVVELTSRISSGDISEVLKQLEIGFDPELDTSRRIRESREEIAAIMKEKDESKRWRAHPIADRYRALRSMRSARPPVDVVLATSMLQVGVDVSRFGLMMMIGQPKNTAEYIQASSRVGRDADRPGLVVTLYNWSRPRDLAHYEDFEHYHATFYRQVEALSVTPYTARALDRGATGAFVAAVRNVEEAHSRNRDAEDVKLDSDVVSRIAGRIVARAEVVGGPRARQAVDERLKMLIDLWNAAKTGPARLGYERKKSTTKEIVDGLLHRAGNGPWDPRTVGNSMRETENEINLLLPPDDGIFLGPVGAPEWSFLAGAAGADADEPVGDEMGVTALDGKGK
ncbi:DISARM system helicase DrmA [Microbispora sp. NBC_01189]|uniref:DISARM system helicase DrmA n=1 Tax=Microbispora sp. NBC_01189 TaxID=2903583 RepID=UPI002E1641B3|nr:DISARM system helicase DrmA [Microbispora sp. NBC_01189]